MTDSAPTALDRLADTVPLIAKDHDAEAELHSIVTEIGAEGWLDGLDDYDQRVAGGFILLAIAERGASYLRALVLLLGCSEVPDGFDTIHDRAAVAVALSKAADSLDEEENA